MYTLKKVQQLPISPEEAWDYFSNPANLSKITPKDMGFTIKGTPPEKMYPGLMIHYTVSPLFRIPMSWTTEITHVNEGVFFVDEQRSGPYSVWHHEHHFKPIEGGVEMTDIVTYKVPLGILGRLVHPFIVRPKLESIFNYREKVIRELWGS